MGGGGFVISHIVPGNLSTSSQVFKAGGSNFQLPPASPKKPARKAPGPGETADPFEGAADARAPRPPRPERQICKH